MNNLFASDAPATKTLIDWWEGLEQEKGTRAELRRAERPEEIMLHPAYSRLHGQLAELLKGNWQWEYRLARVIGLLVHVRKNDTSRPLAKQMGGNPPIVSELRFRRLLQCKHGDLYPRLRRTLAMLDGRKANLPDLIDAAFHWNDHTRKTWALAYFAVTPEQKSA